jgi:hypothetical protein
MAGTEVLLREQAVALQEAVQTVERLLPEEGTSERLERAQTDMVGRGMDSFVFSMVVSELTRVVADQQERIEKLEKGLEDVEAEATREPTEASVSEK